MSLPDDEVDLEISDYVKRRTCMIEIFEWDINNCMRGVRADEEGITLASTWYSQGYGSSHNNSTEAWNELFMELKEKYPGKCVSRFNGLVWL